MNGTDTGSSRVAPMACSAAPIELIACTTGPCHVFGLAGLEFWMAPFSGSLAMRIIPTAGCGVVDGLPFWST